MYNLFWFSDRSVVHIFVFLIPRKKFIIPTNCWIFQYSFQSCTFYFFVPKSSKPFVIKNSQLIVAFNINIRLYVINISTTKNSSKESSSIAENVSYNHWRNVGSPEDSNDAVVARKLRKISLMIAEVWWKLG